MDKRLIIGEIVHVLGADGEVWPAVVLRVLSDVALNLRVLCERGDYDLRGAIFSPVLTSPGQWTWRPKRPEPQ